MIIHVGLPLLFGGKYVTVAMMRRNLIFRSKAITDKAGLQYRTRTDDRKRKKGSERERERERKKHFLISKICQ